MFGTIDMIKDQKAATILKAVHNVVTTYKTGGFRITSTLGDGQFEALIWPLSCIEVELNISSNNEHVPEIERYIRTVKEKNQRNLQYFTFQKNTSTVCYPNGAHLGVLVQQLPR